MHVKFREEVVNLVYLTGRSRALDGLLFIFWKKWTVW